jgi:hypothetical protein
MGNGMVQGGLISPGLFIFYVYGISPPSDHVELALYVDNTAFVVTSCKPTLLVIYLD